MSTVCCTLVSPRITQGRDSPHLQIDWCQSADTLTSVHRRSMGVLRETYIWSVLYMEIHFHFTGFTTKHTAEFKSLSFLDPRLSQSDLNKIVSLLKECSYKWREIGASLGFRSEELSSISGRPSLYSPDSYLRELLSQWLDWPTPYHPDPPTWEILLQALKRADLKELAERVNKEVGIYGKCIEVLVQCTCVDSVDSLVPRHSRGGKREPKCAVYACAYMYTLVFLHSSFFFFFPISVCTWC